MVWAYNVRVQFILSGKYSDTSVSLCLHNFGYEGLKKPIHLHLFSLFDSVSQPWPTEWYYLGLAWVLPLQLNLLRNAFTDIYPEACLLNPVTLAMEINITHLYPHSSECVLWNRCTPVICFTRCEHFARRRVVSGRIGNSNWF